MVRNRRSTGSYFAELLVIILGVTVSFMLNEWRENSKDETREKELLVGIINDLKSDTTSIGSELRELEPNQFKYEFFLSGEYLEYPDSGYHHLDIILGYAVVNFNRTTYTQITSGSSHLISNKELLNNIIDLHTNRIPSVETLLEVDKMIILEMSLPYLIEALPRLSGLQDPDHIKETNKLLKTARVQNLIFSGFSIYLQKKEALESLKEDMVELIREIESEVQSIND